MDRGWEDSEPHHSNHNRGEKSLDEFICGQVLPRSVHMARLNFRAAALYHRCILQFCISRLL